MASSSSGKRHSDAEWLRHKPMIERMFVHEKKSLIETRQRLEGDGFLVTKAQLEYKLKLWGLRRRAPKSTSDATWQFVDHRLQRRQKQGKETEVVIDNRIVDAETVRKEINRHQESTLAKVSRLQQNTAAGNSPSAESPMAPDGLEICLNTPAPLPMRFLWPANLPWNQFQDKFSPVLFAPSLLMNMDNVSLESDSHKGDTALSRMLCFLFPCHSTGISITQLAAEIGSIMPESYENENFGRASRLLQGTTEERHTEYVKLTLYKLSNNLVSDNVGYEEWKNITELLETSGIMETPIQLERITDITMNAIAEKLFQYAMTFTVDCLPTAAVQNSVSSKIINWLLKSGQNPNIRVQYASYAHGNLETGTPLQMAAWKGSLHLMSRLLDHGACPNLTYKSWDEDSPEWINDGMHPLLMTVLKYPEYPSSDDGRLLILGRLLELGPDVSMGSVIRMMMRASYCCPKLMETLIHKGLDIFDEVKAPRHLARIIDKTILIGCTANFRCKTQELHPFFRLLEDAGIQNRFQIPKTVDITSIVLLAAARGNTEFLEDLHNYGIDITAVGSLGCSALHAAAYFGHLETCEKLVLEHRAPVNALQSSQQAPSSLHFAAAAGHLNVVRFLLENKADVNREFKDRDGNWNASFFNHKYYKCESSASPVGLALGTRTWHVAQYLLENGANAPIWAADAASGCQEFEIREKLVKLAVEAGADPSWELFPRTIYDRYREALRLGDIVRAQQLVLDAQEYDLWHDPRMSILEAAIITCQGQAIGKTFAKNPDAYDPGALCATVLFSARFRDSITIHQLLLNRPQSKETSDMEALAIGLAAWSGQMEVLKLLLAELHQPALAKAPENLRNGPRTLPPTKFSEDRLPFWHQACDLVSVSPIVFALRSREALSLMLNHGYRPDRFTMRAAISGFDPDIVRRLMQSPRLSGPDHIQGPLSYAARLKKYDVVRFLLENGEDVNEDSSHVKFNYTYEESNRSPLQSAVENGDLYLLDLLLKSGADVNAPAARDHGATALQLAAISGRLGILRTLIEHGADINAPGAEINGRTVLEGAAEHGRIDVIQYLLSGGARTTDGNRLQYLRAIRYAELRAHMVAANLLRCHREWTTQDHTLWARLKDLSTWDLEIFEENTQEVPSSLILLGDNTTVKDSEVESESTKDGSDHPGSKEDVCDHINGMEPPDDLENLARRTDDPMIFMVEEM